MNHHLSEKSWTQKIICCIILLYEILEKQNYSNKNRSVVAEGPGKEKKGLAEKDKLRNF